MNFIAKEDYGLRAALDIAVHGGSTPAQTREIAARQQIPEPFLEQMLASLRRAGIIRSTRGAGGGYTLAAPPDRITVGQILRALSGPLIPSDLIDGDTGRGGMDIPEVAVIRRVWGGFHQAIGAVVEQTTLQDLLDRRSATVRDTTFMMHI
jgi:Rrf2 family protein